MRFKHNVPTHNSNDLLAGLKCQSTSMEDSFQIFTKALVWFARRDFGSIAFLVAILVFCLLPTCMRRWNALCRMHSNKRIVSTRDLLVWQTKRQDYEREFSWELPMYGLLKSQNRNIKNRRGNGDVSVLTLPEKQTRNCGVDIYLGVRHSSQQNDVSKNMLARWQLISVSKFGNYSVRKWTNVP